MINLNDAEKQKEFNVGPIPAKSLVKVRLEIRQPKNRADQKDPAVTVYSSGLKGLDLELTVVSGRFEGVRIWENWFLPPSMQTISLTEGQRGVCNGSFSKMRAAIEASRNLDPDDPAADRNINSWFDLHGLEIPVKVGIDKPKPGDRYINNKIAKILTPDMDHYREVMGGGEVISDEPIPAIPEAKETTPAKPAGGWEQTPQQTEPSKPATPQQTNIPDWAK
jgi:hypothetical protein